MARESFVIHTEYIDDLPEENKAEFLMYIFNYGSKGEEPELTGFAQTIWVKIKRRMDYDNSEWENNRAQRSVAGRKGGLKSAEARASKLKQNEANSSEVKQEQANEAVNVSVNEYVTENVNAHTEGACVSDSFKNFGKTQKDCWELIQNHNKTAPTERKIPCSSSFMSFIQKEMREILDATERSVEPEKITQALQNFIKVAKSDTWQKTFTWRSFCKNYQNFMPEYFTLSKYLNSEPETDDATQKPEYKFYMRMKDNTRFSIDLFQAHIEEWKAEGRPEGADYFKLQNEWEAQECL